MNEQENLLSFSESGVAYLGLEHLFSGILEGDFWCEYVCDQTQAAFFKMLQTAGLGAGRTAVGGTALLCLCRKSCGGIASVVAGGTKVWIRRNGHRWEMESSFRGGKHVHTCVYIGLRHHSRMHSSTHGGLTRSGSTFSRLTWMHVYVRAQNSVFSWHFKAKTFFVTYMAATLFLKVWQLEGPLKWSHASHIPFLSLNS